MFLDADIDLSDGLSEQFESIGYWEDYYTYNFYFKGHLLVRGYTISNLEINSSMQNVGLKS